MANFKDLLASIERNTLLAAKRVLTIAEASQLSGLSEYTLRRLVSAHKLGAYRPGKKNLYFAREDVEAYLMSGRIETDDEVERGAAKALLNRKGGKK